MNNFLTTEELLKLIEHSDDLVIIKPSDDEYVPIPKIKGKFKIIYWVLLAIACFHVFYVSLLLFLPDRGVNLFGSAAYLAVPFDQEVINNTVTASISIISDFNQENINPGDLVAYYGRYGQNILVVDQVALVNDELSLVIVSQDGFIETSVVPYDDIIGIYVKPANFGQMIIFVSTNTRGYLVMIGSYVLLFGLIYYFYMKKPKDKPIVID